MKLEAKLSELIKVKTISNYEEKNSFLEFQSKIKEIFPLFFKTAETSSPHGTLLMKWPGKNHNEQVLFMNHHDVVEATGKWEYEPFSGTITKDKVWGRGTIDTKGGLCCMIEAAEELIQEGFVPECDIYFFSDSQEETNGNGAKFVSNMFKEKNINFKYVLDEGGAITQFPIKGCEEYFAIVGVEEKGCADFKFVANSHGGHSSTPEKNSPLVRLGKFMAEIYNKNLFEVKISDTLCEMFRRVAPSCKGIIKTLLSHPVLNKPILKFALPRISATMNAMTRTTLCFTQAKGSNADNVIPERAYVLGNMRYSSHQGYESSIKEVEKIANKYDIKIEHLDHAEHYAPSDYNSEEFKLIEKSISKAYDGTKTIPYIMTGASDSKFFTQNSKNVLRLSPLKITLEQVDSIHGLNENVDIDSLYKAVDFYKEMMRG